MLKCFRNVFSEQVALNSTLARGSSAMEGPGPSRHAAATAGSAICSCRLEDRGHCPLAQASRKEREEWITAHGAADKP